MGFKCGIVGLPNVGKSTLFNALTSTSQAEAANYPFCTIEPNKALVCVPDERLVNLAKIANSQKIIPTQIEFVDIAGLVRGASKGEGLGNKFLSHIREVDVIIHVVRCFNDKNITHVEGELDPLRDLEIIETELVVADLENVEKRIASIEKKAKSGDVASKKEYELMKIVLKKLEEGLFAREVLKDNIDYSDLKLLNLITSKPMMYVLNVEEDCASVGNDLSNKIIEYANRKNIKYAVISAKIEEEIASFESEEEKLDFLKDIGLKETGLSKIIRQGYDLLDLITFFTIGPKEAHAWTVKKGAKAPQAAGEIHTDFEKGFIRAETIKFEDYIKYNGELGCKDNGKMRLEGKDYLVVNGDIFHFRFNV